ncbi:MAG: methylthioribulose 1-phosphate dehydratase [Pirellulaceae bacterium]
MKLIDQYADSIHAMQDVGQLFFHRGWSVGTSSNYSVVVNRDPCQLLITASGKDKGRLAEEDFVLIDDTGQPVHAGQPKSSAETLLHCVLAKHAGAGSILHTHSVWGTLLSQYYFSAGGFAMEDYEMLKGLDGVVSHQHTEWVDIFDNTQDIASLANELSQRFVDGRAPAHGFLMRQHGLYTWGKTIEDARRHIEIFEFLFECLVRKQSLFGATGSPAGIG